MSAFFPRGNFWEPWVAKTVMKLFPGPQIITDFILCPLLYFLFCIQGRCSGTRRDSRNQIPQKGSGENHASGRSSLHPLGWAIGYVCLFSWQINEPFSWFVMSAFIGQGRRHWSIWSNSWWSLFTILYVVRTLVEWNIVIGGKIDTEKEKSHDFSSDISLKCK